MAHKKKRGGQDIRHPNLSLKSPFSSFPSFLFNPLFFPNPSEGNRRAYEANNENAGKKTPEEPKMMRNGLLALRIGMDCYSSVIIHQFDRYPDILFAEVTPEIYPAIGIDCFLCVHFRVFDRDRTHTHWYALYTIKVILIHHCGYIYP